MSRVVLVVVLIAGAACSKSSDAKATKVGPGSTVATNPQPQPPAQAPGTVVVYLNDKLVATIDATRLATWPRLDSVVPVEANQLGTWTAIAVKGKAPADIQNPSAKFQSFVPVLYPGPDGPTMGWFDLVELVHHGAAKTTYAGVTEIRITRDEDSDRGQNEDAGVKDFDPSMIDIAIEGGSMPVLAGKDILDIPRESPPNGDTATQGWKLTTLIAKAGIKNPPKLLLSDGTGTQVTLTAKELDPAVSVPFLKLNKKGQLRFRVYTKQADGWQLGGNLRSVTSIKVVK